MDVTAYFTDLSAQFRAVQNRIRHLIGDRHWPSDGAWKESVVRSVLRDYLPKSYSVGSGFIVTPDGISSQVDIIIFDDSAPVFFRDGDFVVVTAECVRAVIEVKTSLSRGHLKKALKKLNDIATLLRRRCLVNRPFIGLFAFEATKVSAQHVLSLLKAENGKPAIYEINALSFGDNQFYRYWEYAPGQRLGRPYESWHGYNLPERSQGYFVHNVIEHLFPHAVDRAQGLWYPQSDKEDGFVGCMPRKDPVAAL